jgi:hypothetical protein
VQQGKGNGEILSGLKDQLLRQQESGATGDASTESEFIFHQHNRYIITTRSKAQTGKRNNEDW